MFSKREQVERHWMLDDLKRMVIFSQVVDTGGFTAAARKLGIAKSAVSKHVSVLEQNIGVRLLNRSTRGLSLTDVGELYYQSCSRINEAVEEARHSIGPLQEEPQGTLRVACPVSYGIQHIAPSLNAYLQAHPSLNAELLLDDNVVDMVQQGIDVAIRVGWLPDSSLRARKLGNAQRMLCASPDYLARRGTPHTPEDLTQHEWIIFTLLPTPCHCTFSKNRRNKTVQVKGRIKTNNGNAVLSLLHEGAGIAALSDFLVMEDIKAGKLVRLLPDHDIAEAGIFAVYQDQRLPQSKIRGFIDFLAARF